jgi:methylmalonyl-CoA epimerase
MGPERVDHTAVVVRDLDEAIPRWLRLTGGTVVTRQVVREQNVEVAMLQLGDTRMELIAPLDADSGVARFLNRRGECLHHVGLKVPNVRQSMTELSDAGFAFTESEPRHGVDGEVVFLKPASTGGVLVELAETITGEET